MASRVRVTSMMRALPHRVNSSADMVITNLLDRGMHSVDENNWSFLLAVVSRKRLCVLVRKPPEVLCLAAWVYHCELSVAKRF